MRRDIQNVVADILDTDELARKDDCYLILKVVEKLEPNFIGVTFAKVMTEAKYKGISFESITRARRKYMNKHPELKDLETERARAEEENEYFMEYSRYGY